MCGDRIFMRSAGMRHSLWSTSNSSQRAPRNSPVRTKVSKMSLKASLVIGSPE